MKSPPSATPARKRPDTLVTLMCAVMVADQRAGRAFAWRLTFGPEGRSLTRSDLPGESG